MKQISGALRDLLVAPVITVASGASMGQRWWADQAPDGATFPYGTILDSISTDPDLEGDAAIIMFTRTSQVDLWQKAGDEDGDFDKAVLARLNGAKLDMDGTIMRVKVEHSERIFEPDTYIAHRFFTLNVRHDASAF